MNFSIFVGSKVRVLRTTPMCCGTTMQGNTGEVVNLLRESLDWSEKGMVVVLNDGSLHWSNDLEVIND